MEPTFFRIFSAQSRNTANNCKKMSPIMRPGMPLAMGPNAAAPALQWGPPGALTLGPSWGQRRRRQWRRLWQQTRVMGKRGAWCPSGIPCFGGPSLAVRIPWLRPSQLGGLSLAGCHPQLARALAAALAA
jgi:hypothetical protein